MNKPVGKRFTKDYQPSGESKSLAKHKKKEMKRIILQEMEPMLNACIEKIKETGDVHSFDKLLDRAIGKVVQQSKMTHDVQGSLNKMLQTHFFGEPATDD